MSHPLEVVDTSNLTHLAYAATSTISAVPEELFFDPSLLGLLMSPIEQEAERRLRGMSCRVITGLSIGLNVEGSSDLIVGESRASFWGKFVSVDLMGGATEPTYDNDLIDRDKLVPGLVFETFDEAQFDGTLAQTYIHVAVPLLGSLAAICWVGGRPPAV